MVDSKDESKDRNAADPERKQASSLESASTVSPETASTRTPVASNEWHSTMIGDYRIIREIGRGGMGVVYEAEQKQPKRLVALKVIRGGRYIDEHQIKLFEREAQALGRLNHPGIAAIYESGHTPDGQHFFAMELVRGETLKDYLERTGKGEPLSPGRLRERLAIFRKIADAVTYAHQRGVIHRDLKPSNVIVQREFESSDKSSEPGSPGVKILDFGLARITDMDIAVATIGTEVGKIQGTLPYMSPEQIRGNPDEIDVRSDVYSLGVILYEMIAGHRPYDVHQAMIHEAARIICETPPAPISKSWSGTRRLDKDIETIIGKALEKAAARRYQSVSAFGEDISRFLTGQPINARPPSAIYQLQKLALRHKFGFGFAAFVVILIVAFAVVMSVQAEKIALERDRANREAETSSQVSEFLVSLFEISDPFEGRGRDVPVGEILDRGAARIPAELQDQPVIQSEIGTTIGRVYRSLGLFDKAIELTQAGLEIREREFGHESLEVAESLNLLGALKLNIKDLQTAEQLLNESYEIRRNILGLDHADVAESLNDLANVQFDKGNWEKSEELTRQALAIFRKVFGDDDLHVASTLNNLAVILEYQEKYADATPLYQEALSIRRRNLGPAHPFVAQSLNNLGMLYLRVNNYTDAEELFQEAMSINREQLGDGHPEVAANLNNLGLVNLKMEKYDKSVDYFRQALTLDQNNIGENNPGLANSFQNLGVALTGKKDFGEAEEALRKALSLKLLQFDRNHWQVATTKSLLGANLLEQHKYNEAGSFLIESYNVIKDRFGLENDRTRKAGERVVHYYQAVGKKDEAAKIQEELNLLN